MKPEEMQARSKEKVTQVMKLLEVLHLKVEARERLTQEGFIEKIVFWIDSEKYPGEPVAPQTETATAEPAPTGEAGENNA